MKVHLRHRFSPSEHLEMIEYASDRYDVTYLTHEGEDEEGREQWFCNNSDVYNSFADAVAGFNRRREASEPFRPLFGA